MRRTNKNNMRNQIHSLILVLCMVIHVSWLLSVEQIKEGNLALRDSLQPSPLFAIGQNIFGKHEVLLQSSPIFNHGKHINSIFWANGIIYSPSDYSSIYFIVPTTPLDHIGEKRARGLNDIFIQCEYCYYKKQTETYTAELTVLGNIFWPTGEIDQPIPLGNGNGSMSYYLGGTASITQITWYAYADAGCLITTRNNGTKFGDTVLYEWGIGRNLGNPKKGMLTGILVFNGIYTQPDVMYGKFDCNSGGNTLFFGGELYFARDPIVAQIGLQWPIMQQLKGKQHTIDFRLGCAFTWVFS